MLLKNTQTFSFSPYPGDFSPGKPLLPGFFLHDFLAFSAICTIFLVMKHSLTYEALKAEKRGEFDHADMLKEMAIEDNRLFNSRVRDLNAADNAQFVDDDY